MINTYITQICDKVICINLDWGSLTIGAGLGMGIIMIIILTKKIKSGKWKVKEAGKQKC